MVFRILSIVKIHRFPWNNTIIGLFSRGDAGRIYTNDNANYFCKMGKSNGWATR